MGSQEIHRFQTVFQIHQIQLEHIRTNPTITSRKEVKVPAETPGVDGRCKAVQG